MTQERRPRPAGNFWTVDEIAEVLERHLRGALPGAIAKAMYRREQAVVDLLEVISPDDVA